MISFLVGGGGGRGQELANVDQVDNTFVNQDFSSFHWAALAATA